VLQEEGKSYKARSPQIRKREKGGIIDIGQPCRTEKLARSKEKRSLSIGSGAGRHPVERRGEGRNVQSRRVSRFAVEWETERTLFQDTYWGYP